MPASPAPLAAPSPVVDADWVREHRGRLVLADVRWYLDGRDGREAHLAGHLPGAVWVDVDTVLSAPPSVSGGRHPLPGEREFARALGALGIGDDTTVVAYDDNGGAYAARLVWLLRRTGGRAALLDGGLQAWDGGLETGPVVPVPAARTPVAWPGELLRSADEVAKSLAAGTAVVLDARAPDRYSGATVLPSDVRSGHVPGARSAPWAANLTAGGRFAPAAHLAAHYAALGVTPGTDAVVYCGSGVTACHDLLALELAGVPTAALYPGSWSAWSADPSRAVVTGEEPG
ncbi:sulfurtransferase [Streptomyces sp. NPDC005435]|uniref:sulfurtransferase n=1 Tax=Streptomyces sp. NPDC005435 TaxID=3154464 RepID=UPI003456F85C